MQDAVSEHSAADVAVVSDRALVAETVAAALTANGLAVVRVPWPRPEDADSPWNGLVDPPPCAVMLCELEAAVLGSARRLVVTCPGRCLLLTDASPGPAWGAILEVGVFGILSSSVTLDELTRAIARVGAGYAVPWPEDRDSLVEQWRTARSRRAEAVPLLRTLTKRELEVLRLLGAGVGVRQIARLHGVEQSTVRSQVRSILNKLGVHAQLEAVAMLGRAEALAPLPAPVDEERMHTMPSSRDPQDWG